MIKEHQSCLMHHFITLQEFNSIARLTWNICIDPINSKAPLTLFITRPSAVAVSET